MQDDWSRGKSAFIRPFLATRPWHQPATLRVEIARQIREHQDPYLRKIGVAPWPRTSIRQLRAPGAVSLTIRCWDASREPRAASREPKEDQLYRRFSINCKNENSIFHSDSPDAGKILYEYIWVESDEREPLGFHQPYESLNASQFGSRATEDDDVRFRCDTRFVQDSRPVFKALICAGPYKNHPSLIDVPFTAAQVGSPQTGSIINTDLSGTDFEAANYLIMRMLKEIRWQP